MGRSRPTCTLLQSIIELAEAPDLITLSAPEVFSPNIDSCVPDSQLNLLPVPAADPCTSKVVDICGEIVADSEEKLRELPLAPFRDQDVPRVTPDFTSRGTVVDLDRDPMATIHVRAGQMPFHPLRAAMPARSVPMQTFGFPGEKCRLRNEDYSKMLDWLENPDNFAQLHGSNSRTRINGKCTSKKTTFTQMLVVLKGHGFPSMITTRENLGKRYERYVKRYKDALIMRNQSGGGLTEAEIAAGISIVDKLNKACPHFERMDALYGERANVAPPALGTFGFGPDEIQRSHVAEGPIPEADAPAGITSLFDTGSDSELEENAECWGVRSSVVSHGENGDYLNNQDQEDPDCGHPDSVPWGGAESIPSTPIGSNYPAAGSRMGSEGEIPGMETPSTTPPTAAPTPGTIPPSASAPTATPTARGRSRANPTGPPPRHRTSPPTAGASKANLASLYSEKLSQKADYMKSMVDSKRLWKEAELQERREAQREAAQDEARKECLARKHSSQVEADNFVKADRKHRLDREHAHSMLKAERKTELLLELFRSNKSEQEIERLIKVIDSVDGPSE